MGLRIAIGRSRSKGYDDLIRSVGFRSGGQDLLERDIGGAGDRSSSPAAAQRGSSPEYAISGPLGWDLSGLWVGGDLRGARDPLVGSGRGCIGWRGRPAVTGVLGSPAYHVSAVPAPFGSGFWHWKHLLDTAKLHQGLAWATAQQSSGSAMAWRRRSAGVGVPASEVTHWPRYRMQKKGQVEVGLT